MTKSVDRPIFAAQDALDDELSRRSLIFTANYMAERCNRTPAQIRDHMRRHADAIDAQINEPQGDVE